MYKFLGRILNILYMQSTAFQITNPNAADSKFAGNIDDVMSHVTSEADLKYSELKEQKDIPDSIPNRPQHEFHKGHCRFNIALTSPTSRRC